MCHIDEYKEGGCDCSSASVEKGELLFSSRSKQVVGREFNWYEWIIEFEGYRVGETA